MTIMTEAPLSAHALRSRWKPTKERLQANTTNHPTVIRLHRSLSWLDRSQQFTEDQDIDLQLVCLWIAFNGLYGRWDDDRREPQADRACWRAFLDHLLDLDATGYIAAMLQQQRDLVLQILDDEYLSGYFWEEPSGIRAAKSKKAKFDARTWYLEHRWSMILDRLAERVYLMRCQLVHGAATYNSILNRQSLNSCVTMLRHLLNAALLVMFDHGTDEDWGTMCYPPLDSTPARK